MEDTYSALMERPDFDTRDHEGYDEPPDTTEEQPIIPATKQLDFTLVHGYLRGEHRCPFELHATGCRDLNKLKQLNLFSFNVYAPTREDAHVAAAAAVGIKENDVWVQPCCTLKRMQAIGRA
jgi:hypothetical protein